MISCWLTSIEQMDLLKGPVSVERQVARQDTNTLAHLRMKETWLRSLDKVFPEYSVSLTLDHLFFGTFATLTEDYSQREIRSKAMPLLLVEVVKRALATDAKGKCLHV